MSNTKPYRVKSISDFHQMRGLPKPEHPLISVINMGSIAELPDKAKRWTMDFYSISLKRCQATKIKYGQQQYDFDEGLMFFLAPHQVLSIEASETIPSGWLLLVHPDFLWNTPLAQSIRAYDYFDYAVHEALFLSEKEEIIITDVMQKIRQEYQANIDAFSQDIIISQIETLLNYADRFYHRQFITRKKSNHQVLARLEETLINYFNNDLFEKGLPSVQAIAEELNVSPNYLSTLLKEMTGRSTQQHIHNKLIEKAKGKLSTTNLSISEIAYDLGFEHSQSFSKLFKHKTNITPSEFRQSFN